MDLLVPRAALGAHGPAPVWASLAATLLIGTPAAAALITRTGNDIFLSGVSPVRLKSGHSAEPACMSARLSIDPYSTTSSASASSVLGTLSSIGFAVFRLSTNRKRVGSSTGRSAGLAPLKMRSTRAAE